MSRSDRVARLDAAALDRLVARGALAQPPERLVDRGVVDVHRLAAQRDARVVAGIDRRHGVEGRRELQRLALFHDDVADVGRVDRLDPALAQRIVHGARDQAVRDVVEDLVAEALPDDLGGHLAGPEARDARGPAVVARDLVDLRVDDGAGDFDDEVLLRVADVDELGFHCGILRRCRGCGASAPTACIWRPPSRRSRRAAERRLECERGESNPHSLPATGS